MIISSDKTEANSMIWIGSQESYPGNQYGSFQWGVDSDNIKMQTGLDSRWDFPERGNATGRPRQRPVISSRTDRGRTDTTRYRPALSVGANCRGSQVC